MGSVCATCTALLSTRLIPQTATHQFQVAGLELVLPAVVAGVAEAVGDENGRPVLRLEGESVQVDLGPHAHVVTLSRVPSTNTRVQVTVQGLKTLTVQGDFFQK